MERERRKKRRGEFDSLQKLCREQHQRIIHLESINDFLTTFANSFPQQFKWSGWNGAGGMGGWNGAGGGMGWNGGAGSATPQRKVEEEDDVKNSLYT